MSDDERRQRLLNIVSGISIAALTITTAWGNAIGMFVVSVIVLVAILACSGKLAARAAYAAAVVFAAAFLVAMLVQNL